MFLPKNYIARQNVSRKKCEIHFRTKTACKMFLKFATSGSILPTFYGQLLLYKSVLQSFFSTSYKLSCIFTGRRMLVRLITDLYVTLASVSCYLWLICEKAFSSFLFVVSTSSICTSLRLLVMTSWWSIILNICNTQKQRYFESVFLDMFTR
jgi:hypothetical protein